MINRGGRPQSPAGPQAPLRSFCRSGSPVTLQLRPTTWAGAALAKFRKADLLRAHTARSGNCVAMTAGTVDRKGPTAVVPPVWSHAGWAHAGGCAPAAAAAAGAPLHIKGPCGLMDKALVFGTKDCRFESCQGHSCTHNRQKAHTDRLCLAISSTAPSGPGAVDARVLHKGSCMGDQGGKRRAGTSDGTPAAWMRRRLPALTI